ncbi:MAG: sulfotransferase [Planctomycetota bacterium]|nr:MAG: sulfotransferase [Planctomycetota bacterium]
MRHGNKRMSRFVPAWLMPGYDLLVRAGRWGLTRPVPLHRGEGFRPVFLIGSGRSGNTLLRRILQAGRDLHIPPETFVLGRVIRLFLRNRHLPWDHLVRLVMGWFAFHQAAETFGVPLHPLVQELLEMPREQRSLARMLDAFYRYHGTETKQTFVRWGDKTPYNTFALDWIRRTFPDARFVHVLRDGADVVVSYVRASLQPDVESAARRWVRSVRLARSFARRHPRQCREVRYEDLVTQPEATVESLCRFLDIRYHPEMITRLDHADAMGDVARYEHMKNVARPVTADSIGRGRRTLDAADRARLGKIMNRTLVACGYEPLR